jgi:hypothetical protein
MNFENLNMGNNVADNFKQFCSYLVNNHASDITNACVPLHPSHYNRNAVLFITHPSQLRRCPPPVRRQPEEAAVQDLVWCVCRHAERGGLVKAPGSHIRNRFKG